VDPGLLVVVVNEHLNLRKRVGRLWARWVGCGRELLFGLLGLGKPSFYSLCTVELATFGDVLLILGTDLTLEQGRKRLGVGCWRAWAASC
jgi:hypothetical protein